MQIPELLAPAGNFECAETAFLNGADAIYIGVGTFNLRAHSPNFTIEDLPDLLSMAHEKGKKVFLTFNAMPDDAILKKMEFALESIGKLKFSPDALIVSDPGVVTLCKDVVSHIPLHLSTQTGTFNSRAIAFWKCQGISRVIFPRECTVNEISDFVKTGLVETEIFVHGAMCVSISGRCLLGAYMSQRHPNHGDCSQPCRFSYTISPTDNSSQSLTVEESSEGVYLLNSKDLCTIDILPDIVKTGVSSLKIEGRNKSAHYIAVVVGIYRAALDKIKENCEAYSVDPMWIKELDGVEHRPYTNGFLGNDIAMQEVFTSKATAGYRLVGVVKGVLEGGDPVIDVKNSFGMNEQLNILPVQQRLGPYNVSFSSFDDLSGNNVPKAIPNRLVVGKGAGRLRPGDMIRRPV